MAKKKKKKTAKDAKDAKEELRFSEGNSPPPARLRAILASDYPAVLCLIGPVIGWAIYALVVFDVLEGGVQSSRTFLGVAIGITLVCAIGFVWRVRSVQRVFSRGVEVAGEVVDVGFHKDRGTVAFSYEHQGKAYTATRALHASAAARALEPGQAVVVVVDQTNPKSALIRNLFV